MSNLVTSKSWSPEDKQRMLIRCQGDLWYLATEIVGFDLLTPDFHKPMMDDMDAQRRAYMESVRRNLPTQFPHEEWPRDYYKTTVRIAQCVQDYLCDGAWTNYWYHAIEEKAVEATSEVARIIQENDAVRRLLGDVAPSKRDRNFQKGGKFKLAPNKDKAQSLQGVGAGSESTGGHAKGVYGDDIIGLNDVEDSLMPKKRRWFGQTLMNVLRTDVGWFRSVGTRWDEDDLYADYRKNPRFVIRRRACYETEGVPDWEGDPVLHTREIIEAKRSSMSPYEFSCQMMNDPLPAKDRIWQKDCEEFIDFAELSRYPGRNFVLSDPAPALVGSLSSVDEKIRGDGSKNYWSTAAMRRFVKNGRMCLCLLDGDHSRDWRRPQGAGGAAALMSRWGTDLCIFEFFGGGNSDYTDEMVDACRSIGQRLYLDRRGLLPRFADNYGSGQKNSRVANLCDWMRDGRFFILSSCSEEFLYGDGEHSGLLTQGRKFRPLVGGRNNLKFDDDIDITARGTDSALDEFTPQALAVHKFSPYRRPQSGSGRPGWGTRYINFGG